MKTMAAFLGLIALGAASATAQDPKPAERPFWRTVVMGTKAMVAAEHPLEAQAAQKVLLAGGNAIDAAVAAFYMTTVVEHHQAGIGGDAFIMIWLAREKRMVFINGTGFAPALATRAKYLEAGGIPDAGPLASSVPGAVAGFDLALRKYGTKKYAEVLQPAIDAASNGHPLTFWAASNHVTNLEKVSKYPSSSVLLKNGKAFDPGDLFVQKDLGQTLQTIARNGAAAFYQGAIARRIDAFQTQHGGLIRAADLAAIKAEEAAPIRTTYRGLDVYQSAPNSQGIVMLIALNILEGYDLKALGQNSADYAHVVTEALKLAFADRNKYIGDPNFVKDMPVEGLLSKEYATARRGLIRMDRAIDGVAPAGDPRRRTALLPGATVSYAAAQPLPESPRSVNRGAIQLPPDGETSSFSIADQYGNVVSVTHSINGGFGSGMVIDGLGFVLNNRLQYFSLEESDVNVLVPGKRPRHTINPAIVLKDGRPYLALNTPGGDNQPQAMLQAFLNVVEFGMNVQQAVEAPTLTTFNFAGSNYPQRAENRLALPQVLADRIGASLSSRGHTLQIAALQQPYGQAPSGAGAVKLILIDAARGVFFGGVAPSKDNYVIGW